MWLRSREILRMFFGTAALFLAQIASASDAPTRAVTSKSPAPTASATATATVRIVRPVAVRVDRKTGEVEVSRNARHPAQRKRDDKGTVWIEFS